MISFRRQSCAGQRRRRWRVELIRVNMIRHGRDRSPIAAAVEPVPPDLPEEAAEAFVPFAAANAGSTPSLSGTWPPVAPGWGRRPLRRYHPAAATMAERIPLHVYVSCRGICT